MTDRMYDGVPFILEYYPFGAGIIFFFNFSAHCIKM